MSIHSLWAASSGGVIAVMMIFVLTRPAPPVVAATTEPEPQEGFSETWRSATVPLIFKNVELARVFAAAIGPPRSREDSESEKIATPVEVAAARSNVLRTGGATVSVRRHPRNLCQRHSMRKVWVTSKRWRCRK